MEKSKLINFINRYYLGGNTDTAKLVIENNTLSTKFISSDQNVIGDVTMKSFDQPDAELGVYTTSQLVKLMSALDETIDITLSESGGRVFSMNMSDKDTKVTYMLADLAVIRQAPNLKQLPPFEVKIQLNKDFAGNFKKAANALDSDNFGVVSADGDTKIIINYSNVNTNRIVFNTATVESGDMEVVCFSAKLLKEILNANTGIDGILEVSSKGLARVTFENDHYSAVYYLVKLTVS